jgi:hypothetical protein
MSVFWDLGIWDEDFWDKASSWVEVENQPFEIWVLTDLWVDPEVVVPPPEPPPEGGLMQNPMGT